MVVMINILVMIMTHIPVRRHTENYQLTQHFPSLSASDFQACSLAVLIHSLHSQRVIFGCMKTL